MRQRRRTQHAAAASARPAKEKREKMHESKFSEEPINIYWGWPRMVCMGGTSYTFIGVGPVWFVWAALFFEIEIFCKIGFPVTKWIGMLEGSWLVRLVCSEGRGGYG